MKIKPSIYGLCLTITVVMLIAGCGHSPSNSPGMTNLDPELTPYELDGRKLLQQAEQARQRDEFQQELELISEYNRNYTFNETTLIRELDLYLQLEIPERVVLVVDRLLPEQRGRGTWERLGRGFEMLGEYDDAALAYEQALAIQFDQEILDAYMGARMKSSDQEMAREFEEIADSPWVTRDELSVLIVRTFESLLPVSGKSPVIVDIDHSSHEDALLKVVAAGLLNVGRDHRVMPNARVRKLDLARVFYNLMIFADAVPSDELTENVTMPWDLTSEHSSWQAVSCCFAAGLLGTEPDGRFQSAKVLNGSDVMVAFEAMRSWIRQPRTL